ncbi:LCP family protein [Streptomonospora litoralis]|uniref:Transcriptional regulator YvhJ n=1 Tax=Streptomonospora litoralis TaxID=2498135 RepID=A0A4P6QA44_9ACTN|nr:LCP family protein [Streptomonospora litoralis]QBI56571.1 Putative transcriptional regulator YvhJ [Streptomonospora litoralis]
MPDDARGADSGSADPNRPQAPEQTRESGASAAREVGGASTESEAEGGARRGESGTVGDQAESAAKEDRPDPATGEPGAQESGGSEAAGAAGRPGVSAESAASTGRARNEERTETAENGDAADDSHSRKPTATAPRSAKRRRLPRLAAWTAALAAVVLVAAAGTAYGYYHSLQNDIVRHDLDAALDEEDRPEKIGDDVNILFIGSDGREGGNAAYGGRDFVGERSDALMLAHISPDGRATVVNFPRDSLVQLPECAPYGETEGTAGYHGMINAALFHGGPPCVVKTVESLTDIRIDHFAHLSFVGFREMIDAIGGVRMCIPQPMHDERAQLDLEAGDQRLSGEEALSFVRARYEIGNGGDIGRIDRQQMFLGALADEVTDSDLLTRPGQATGMLRAVTEHTGTDDEFTLPTMVSIASTLAGTDLSDIAFYTVPWNRAPLDPNRVVWDEAAASRLFSAVRHDRPVEDRLLVTGEEDTGGSGSDDPAASDDAGGGSDAAATPEPSADDPSAGPTASAAPIEGRDATSNPCANGLGRGTESAEESRM